MVTAMLPTSKKQKYYFEFTRYYIIHTPAGERTVWRARSQSQKQRSMVEHRATVEKKKKKNGQEERYVPS